jgi:hypothetical protein
MHEHSLSYIAEVGFWLAVFLWLWDKVDGASRWQQRQEAENKRVLAEGWRKWASTPENSNLKTR